MLEENREITPREKTHQIIKEQPKEQPKEQSKTESKIESKTKSTDKIKDAPTNDEIFEDDGKELELDTIVAKWEEVLQTIKTKKVNVYALLMEGEPISYSNNLLTIGYKDDFGIHREAISTPTNADIVKGRFSKFFKKNIDVKFVMKSDKPLDKKVEKDNKDKAIKEVIDFFGEDIVEIK